MYEKAISRMNPGCIVFLLDRSDSMKFPWQGNGSSMAQGAAQAVNKILLELCLSAATGSGRAPRHYFDIGVFGYGACPIAGGEGVETAFSGVLAEEPLVPVPKLFTNPLAVVAEQSIDAVPNARVPVWIEPVFGYRTPMCQAIAVAGEHVFDWAGRHPYSFPPIIINITDGMVTDSPFQGVDLAGWARRLTSISTNDGPALLLNIFLSPTGAAEVLFPTNPARLPDPGPELFAISSPLPAPMIANARGSGIRVDDGARALAFNAGPATLVKFLEIGSRVADMSRNR